MNATEFGPCCPQVDDFVKLQDEECLYLNIFAPLNAKSTDRLPVLFWIHGAGGDTGCSSQSIPRLYNGTNMIAQGQKAIVVTINYRLGVLGTLFLEELAQENSKEWPTSGNYNLLDAQSALRWTQKNIGKFGGDPSRVLLFGESSGANMAIDLGACRGSAGLYHHVISQSSYGMISSLYLNRTESDATGRRLSKLAGCNTVECLRKSNVSNLIRAFNEEPTAGSTVVDNFFMPYYPSIAIEKGTYVNNVGLTIGHNLPDMFPTCATEPPMDSQAATKYVQDNIAMTSILNEKFDSVLTRYQVKSCASSQSCCQAATDLLLDFTFLCNARRLLNGLYARNNRNLYWYRLDCNPTCPTDRSPGVCRHTAEIAFVFGTMSNFASKAEANCSWTPESRTFSTNVIDHWMRIAATGKPPSSWNPFSPNNPNYYHITPYESFSSQSWAGDCRLADEIEQREVDLLFRNSG